MSGPVFFHRGDGLTVADIAAMTGAVPRPGANLERRITGIAPLELAGPSDLAFIDAPKFQHHFASTQAGACLASPRHDAVQPVATSVLVLKKPYPGFVAVAQKLFPEALRPSSLFEAAGVSTDATVHPEARLENGVVIEPGAVVGPGAEIGANSLVGPLAVIGPGVRVGRNCVIGAGAVLMHALIGDRVVIHPGVRIGQDGFGYSADASGLTKIPQIGRVIVQDNVEIGANTTIDRGGMRDTVIGEGSKIDNLVQIGHNVVIGRHCVIVSQCGISGSVTIGDRTMLGGQTGIADNITVGEGSLIAAQSGVMSNVPPGSRWGGTPAMPLRDFMRMTAAQLRLIRRDQKDAEGDIKE